MDIGYDTEPQSIVEILRHFKIRPDQYLRCFGQTRASFTVLPSLPFIIYIGFLVVYRSYRYSVKKNPGFTG